MITDILQKLSKEDQTKIVRTNEPDWTEPMLAYLEHNLFFDKNWFYERKFDGERCLAFIKGNEVRLRSRNNKPLNASYPEIQQALGSSINTSCILDGEVVAFKGNNTSFEKLQQRMQLRDKQEAMHTGIAVYYYIFDILYLDHYDITRLPLKTRKKYSKQLFLSKAIFVIRLIVSITVSSIINMHMIMAGKVSCARIRRARTSMFAR